MVEIEEKMDLEVEVAYERGLKEGKDGSVEEMRNRIEAIHHLEQELSELKTSNKFLEEDNSVLKNEVDESHEEFNKVKGEMEEAQMKNLDYEREKEDLERGKENLEEEMKALKENISHIQTTNQMILSTSRASLGKQISMGGEDVDDENDGEDPLNMILESFKSQIRKSISDGTALWKRGDKEACFNMYYDLCVEMTQKLPQSSDYYATIEEGLESLDSISSDVKKAIRLRKSLDQFLKLLNLTSSTQEGKGEEKNEGKSEKKSSSRRSRQTQPPIQVSEAKGMSREDKLKVKKLEKKVKEDERKISRLEDKIAQMKNSQSKGGGDSGGKDEIAQKRMMERLEKKMKKEKDEIEKKLTREKEKVERNFNRLEKEKNDLDESFRSLTEERDSLKKMTGQLGGMNKEMESLREQVSHVGEMEGTIKSQTQEIESLGTQYREEMTLRKKYWNMMEDMKGKIRVYARCRPMSSSEIERGCGQSVNFIDETTMQLETHRGLKEFMFDAVFDPSSTQDQIFEDTKNLIQSCMDGFNVALFAYGQTGSGIINNSYHKVRNNSYFL